MEGYKKILVPLDGSEAAESVFTEIERVAAPSDARISLLQVINSNVVPYFPYSNPSEFQGQLAESAREYLAGLEERLTSKGLTVESSVQFGDEANGILEYASEHDIELIAMSTHGRSGVERWLLGSVAEKVVRHATQPILLVRASLGGAQ